MQVWQAQILTHCLVLPELELFGKNYSIEAINHKRKVLNDVSVMATDNGFRLSNSLKEYKKNSSIEIERRVITISQNLGDGQVIEHCSFCFVIISLLYYGQRIYSLKWLHFARYRHFHCSSIYNQPFAIVLWELGKKC